MGRGGARQAVPVRAAEPRRGSARRGGALSRPGGARHQAPSSRAGVPHQRPAARGGLRPGRRAAPARAHPRRSRATARDAARAGPRRGAPSGSVPDPRARGDRGSGGHRRARPQRGQHLLRQLDLVAVRPAQPALARSAGTAPVGLRHPVRGAARRAQPVRARRSYEWRGRCHPARHAGGDRARPARRHAAGAALRAARRDRVPILVRARTGQLLPGLGDTVTLDGHARDRRIPGPRGGRVAGGVPGGAGRSRALHGGPLGASGRATVVPGAPPDLIGRGRVFRLLNAAQADTVLG